MNTMELTPKDLDKLVEGEVISVDGIARGTMLVHKASKKKIQLISRDCDDGSILLISTGRCHISMQDGNFHISQAPVYRCLLKTELYQIYIRQYEQFNKDLASHGM